MLCEFNSISYKQTEEARKEAKQNWVPIRAWVTEISSKHNGVQRSLPRLLVFSRAVVLFSVLKGREEEVSMILYFRQKKSR